ncbi:MAG: hypothetical protein ISR58_00075 [Anaerolineales bacterium]|nr:hypothetical protein [Chloroflexota bacterium]MBL6979558.1 hypothetical protein [Anaerolineales bacterium]
MIKRILLILTLILIVVALDFTATIAAEPPTNEEPPLPTLPSERDHHPYNWQPEDVKGLDMWGDSESDATDIIAVYQREMDGNFEFRLDIMNFEGDELAPIYFAIDFLEGGSSEISSGSSLAFEIEWDLLVSMVGNEFKLYDPSFTDISDQLATTEINRQLDFIFFAISDAVFAGWDGAPFQIQAMVLNDAMTETLDEILPAATDDTTGRSKLVVMFADVYYSSSPHEATKHYDGFRELTAQGHSNERAGERRGVRYLLDAVERFEIPLTLIDHRIEELPGSEYLRFNERIRHLAGKGLLDSLFMLGYGHFMPWQPDDIDAITINIEKDLLEGLDLPVSDVFYPYEGMLTSGDIQVIKEAGFEAIFAIFQGHYSFFGWIDDPDFNQAIYQDEIEILRKIHQFNGMKFFFLTMSDYSFYMDSRWEPIDWENFPDTYGLYTGTNQGLHLFWRRVLHDMALDPDQDQYISINSDLSMTPWWFQDAAEWNFQWLASHPWIEVTTFSDIVNRNWEVIDHGELDATTDEVLMRYQNPGDTHYNAYFPQHYYGGISDGHSPVIPAGVEIESYYDYIPYLRDGKLIPSGRIMGDDQTPDSIVYETLANLRAAPDNPITTIAWLSYYNQIGEQTFHDGEVLSEVSKNKANFLSQVNKIVEAAQWVAELEQGTLASDTQAFEKDLDLDGEMEYVMFNDQVFAIFENDGGRLEYAFAYDPDYGPIQLIAPKSMYLFQPGPNQGFDFHNGEAAILLGWSWEVDGAFVEDFDLDGNFEYEPLTASIDEQSLTFSYETQPVSKTFTLQGDTIHAHYELGSFETLNLGFANAVNQLGVFDKDWIWNFEPIDMQEVLGWQMSSGGAVLLRREGNYSLQTASFSDSPARVEMQQREDESSYPEGHSMCFPCSWIKVWDTQEIDFSLTLSAVPIDKSAYTPISASAVAPSGPTTSTEQLDASPVVYDDELQSGWSLDPWSGTADLFSSASVYQGSNAIEVSLEPSGAITFDVGSFDTSAHDYLVFYINGGDTADQALYVELKSREGTSIGDRAILADYTEVSPLQPGQWHVVMVPLSTLNPDGGSMAWFDIGDASGNGASTFYIDEMRFVAVDP